MNRGFQPLNDQPATGFGNAQQNTMQQPAMGFGAQTTNGAAAPTGFGAKPQAPSFNTLAATQPQATKPASTKSKYDNEFMKFVNEQIKQLEASIQQSQSTKTYVVKCRNSCEQELEIARNLVQSTCTSQLEQNQIELNKLKLRMKYYAKQEYKDLKGLEMKVARLAGGKFEVRVE
ncbi:Hypothetical_protein [Hexamita inflata]|uniref:Hypothetical_protein n=1 Tax=Hexamita inflata TaxID=28002 RepID=A0AA86TK12_9EUKA|nr:Hypothetical protein HINF_LOCUS7365 [Hexamita inflata]